jgi:hypothetical protein
MKKVTVLISLCALVLAFAPAALADWDHPVKWDQLEPITTVPSFSQVGQHITADDFLCDETGWITDIEFLGDVYQQIASTSTFLISFWDDVPASASDESHPGALRQEITVTAAGADGLGWQMVGDYDPIGTERKFKINLPQDDWFLQEAGNIYWISIQSPTGGFTIMLLAKGEHWGDDAVFKTPTQPAYDHWGWNTSNQLERYSGLLPNGWTSADMSFRLTGTAIPEPASIALVLGGVVVALLRRRKGA